MYEYVTVRNLGAWHALRALTSQILTDHFRQSGYSERDEASVWTLASVGSCRLIELTTSKIHEDIETNHLILASLSP